MASKSKVYFFFLQIEPGFKNRTALKGFIEKLFKREGKKLRSINYIFCSDEDILKINKQYLKHDFYTDIITFDLSESDQIVAEVYISTERVRENAKSLGTSFISEIHRVIFHGALHLCGYGDKTKSEKVEMRKREDYYLNSHLKGK